MSKDGAFPRVRIPYGTWGSSFFPAWQSSPLAEVNIGQAAGEAMALILGRRRVPARALEYLVIGSTVPWHWKFWTAPLVSSCLGHRLPGCHVEQACATGLQAIAVAALEVQGGGNDAVGVLTFDRTSDSPAGVFPERRGPQRTAVLSDVWDNFGFDPATGGSMLAAAGKAARRHRLDRREIDEITLCRYQQYFAARERGFLDRVLVPLDLLTSAGRPAGRVAEDTGVKMVTLDGLRAMPELDSCVTAGGQTHPADGIATLLVTSPDKARDLSPRPEIEIRLIAKVDVRTGPGLMPEAPALAVQKLLRQTGLGIDQIAVIKSHNPFTVNDAIFSKLLGVDWRAVNRTGSSLVWGHPQGPTLTRIVIEALEEAVELGGGYVLVMGCAAGDVGIAGLFLVS
ncbi:thiolase family protein [Phaeospirillum tilakii]|uniref:Thiolase family protein n=1 Tax=Phaeospirillum tilakii TaxID=741673 RepID=A0ABW5CCB0_9PROT